VAKLERSVSMQPEARINWDAIAEQYASVNEDRSRIVYPRLLEALRDCHIKHVFDFGGGDGRFVEALIEASKDWRPELETVVCYDPSAEMRELARRRLRDAARTLITDHVSEAWVGRCGAVTFNAVWMGLEDESACVQTLREAASLLERDGVFLAAVTHPCFRDRVFHSYSTDFDMGRYLDNGGVFAVRIYDSSHTVGLLDTHWNLEAMTRQLASAGLLLRRIHELPDVSASPAGSPWMLLEAVLAR
jgi:SAM-dependent methyltransferase